MNNAESFVRILFHGLFIIAKNNSPSDGGRPRWEVGLPKAGGHEFLIKLRKVNVETGVTEESKDLSTPALITIRPDRTVALERVEDGTVDRLNDTGNVEHYQWLIDMENREFHDERLRKRNGTDYLSKLYIEGGKLYTYAKTVERYKRFNIPNVNVNHLGRFAAVAAIEITRSVASSITINDGTADTRPQEASFRYELDCTHLPRRGTVSTRSHFPHYYEVLADRNDPDGTKFDIVHVDLPPPTSLLAAEHAETHGKDRADAEAELVRRAVEPQVCNAVFLGQENGGLP